MTETGIRRAGGNRDTIFRWVCPCQEPPVLLATYTPRGRINIKVRDRYWHVSGRVQAICPRCGAEHVLDLRGVDADDDQRSHPAPAANPPHPRRDAG